MTVSCSHQFSHSLAFSLFCVCLKPLDGRGAVAGQCVSKGLGDACRDPVWSRPQLWAFQRSGHKAWKIFLVGGFQAMPLFRRWLWRPARYREVQGQYAFCAWVGGDAPRLGVWLPLRKSGPPCNYQAENEKVPGLGWEYNWFYALLILNLLHFNEKRCLFFLPEMRYKSNKLQSSLQNRG